MKEVNAVRMERRDREPSIVATGPSEACAINALEALNANSKLL